MVRVLSDLGGRGTLDRFGRWENFQCRIGALFVFCLVEFCAPLCDEVRWVDVGVDRQGGPVPLPCVGAQEVVPNEFEKGCDPGGRRGPVGFGGPGGGDCVVVGVGVPLSIDAVLVDGGSLQCFEGFDEGDLGSVGDLFEEGSLDERREAHDGDESG